MNSRPILIASGVLVTGLLAWWISPSPFWRGLVIGLFSGLGLLVGGVAIFVRRMRKRANSAMEAPPIPSEQEPWDYDLTATSLDGSPIDVAAHRDRVLILNRWATWCAPCIAEMPSLARLYEETAESGVDLLCLTTEDRAKVEAFLKKRPLDVPIAIGTEPLPDRFMTRGLPATFIVDPKGHVAFRHVGAARWDDPGVVHYVRGLAVSHSLGS